LGEREKEKGSLVVGLRRERRGVVVEVEVGAVVVWWEREERVTAVVDIGVRGGPRGEGK
jgi:predicted mannosyl-3-phosphoglycerate phosphatase (HAD superfamily)